MQWTPTQADFYAQRLRYVAAVRGGFIVAGTKCRRTDFGTGLCALQPFKILIALPPFLQNPRSDGEEEEWLISEGTPVTYNFVGVSGWTPYTYEMISGSLPDGISFNPTLGTLTGRAYAAGERHASFRIIDAINDDGARGGGTAPLGRLFIKILASTTNITTPGVLPDALVDQNYNDGGGGPVLIEAVGGPGPYTFTIISGALPPGLSLLTWDSWTAVISGTATSLGTYNFTIRVNTTDRAFSITVI